MLRPSLPPPIWITTSTPSLAPIGVAASAARTSTVGSIATEPAAAAPCRNRRRVTPAGDWSAGMLSARWMSSYSGSVIVASLRQLEVGAEHREGDEVRLHRPLAVGGLFALHPL